MLTLSDAERSYLLLAAPGAVASDSLSTLRAKFWSKTATETLADAETRYLKAYLSTENIYDSLEGLRRKKYLLDLGLTSSVLSSVDLKSIYLGIPVVKNILTPNRASGGDILGNTTGIVPEGNGAVVYSTAQAKSGAGSFCITFNQTGISSSGAKFTGLTFVKDALYNVTASFKNGVGSRNRFNITVNTLGGYVPAHKNINEGEWGTINLGFKAPVNTSSGVLYFNPSVVGSAGDTYYVDEIGIWTGVGMGWAMP